jgi:hypothetical protein
LLFFSGVLAWGEGSDEQDGWQTVRITLSFARRLIGNRGLQTLLVLSALSTKL